MLTPKLYVLYLSYQELEQDLIYLHLQKESSKITIHYLAS